MIRCKVKNIGARGGGGTKQQVKKGKTMQPSMDAVSPEEEEGGLVCAIPISPTSQDDDDLHSVGSSAGGFDEQQPEVEDGDLLFFEGSPFHFLDSKAIITLDAAAPSKPFMPTSFDTEAKRLTPRRATAPTTFESQPLQQLMPLGSSSGHFYKVENMTAV